MAFEDEVKKMLVERLRLKITPESITPEMRLVGEGLGLDSIDLIELSVAIEKLYGVEVKNEQEGQIAFQSVGSLIEYIRERRKT